MSSCTGTLSTTDQLRADASISSLRCATACAVHGCPLGTSCRAVTTPVAPVCLMSAKVIGSLGPNHRQVCSIECLQSLSCLSCLSNALEPLASPAAPGPTRSG